MSDCLEEAEIINAFLLAVALTLLPWVAWAAPEPTVNELIVASAYAGVRGELALPTNAGLCLALVRIIVEDALEFEHMAWYETWRTRVTPRQPGDDSDPWARDMEASLRAAGMEVVLPREGGPVRDPTRYVILDLAVLLPGDLLFRWDAPDRRGHVGILMPGGLVLENVFNGNRPTALGRDATVLSPLGAWPVTTAIRFDPSRR